MAGGNVVLIGFSGSGKSAVAGLLATRLGFDACDTDAMVEVAADGTIAEIFEHQGEDVFRELEAAAVDRAAAGNRCVIACGGGAILSLRNYGALRGTGTIVYLRTKASTILDRLGEAADRPLLRRDAAGTIPALLAERAPAYESAADLVVDTDGRTPDDVAGEIERLVRERQ